MAEYNFAARVSSDPLPRKSSDVIFTLTSVCNKVPRRPGVEFLRGSAEVRELGNFPVTPTESDSVGVFVHKVQESQMRTWHLRLLGEVVLSQ
jgi:hypothetical protein